MNRNFSALFGVGIAAVLILCGIWYWPGHLFRVFHGMRHGFMGLGIMAGPGMGLAMMFLWIALIAAVVWALPTAFRRGQGQVPSSKALEILNQRYTEGEIDKAEYETKRRDIL